jgi:hypothetical protein
MKVRVPVATVLAVLLASGRARASGAFSLELGGQAGASTNPLPKLGTNPLGVALGARAGINVVGVYAGFDALDNLGGTGWTSLTYGGELGYGIPVLGFLVIRPQIGIGSFGLSRGSQVKAPTSVSKLSCLYVDPGITLLATLGVFFIGLDLGAIILPSGPTVDSTRSALDVAYTLHGQLGLTF